jgi:hypothetical protein
MQTLKPGCHFIGSGLKPGAFKLWVNWIERVQPYLVVHEGAEAVAVHAHPGVGLSLPGVRLVTYMDWLSYQTAVADCQSEKQSVDAILDASLICQAYISCHNMAVINWCFDCKMTL